MGRFSRHTPGLYHDSETGAFILRDGVSWYVVTAQGWKLLPPFDTYKAAKEFIENPDSMIAPMRIQGEMLRLPS